MQVRQVFSANSDFLTIRPFFVCLASKNHSSGRFCVGLISEGAVSGQGLNEQGFCAFCPAWVWSVTEVMAPDCRQYQSAQQKINYPAHIHDGPRSGCGRPVPISDMVGHIVFFNAIFRKNVASHAHTGQMNGAAITRHQRMPVR